MFNNSNYHQGNDGVWAKEQAVAFGYSDGDENEDRLLSILKSAGDISANSRELQFYQTDWPSIYHLSSLRGNLLRPFLGHFSSGKSVLELGAGCGAITRFLGETGASVVAVEGSRKRASIISERCRNLPNVCIVSDLIQSFESDEKFDVVTLIGVLEYAPVFIEGETPVETLLKLAKSFLKPSGMLIVAIENKIGLKYFAGAPEDHIGLPMFGINNSYSARTPITLGRQELLNEITKIGLEHTQLFIPLPDYKTPITILYPASLSIQNNKLGWDASPLLIASVAADVQRNYLPNFSQEMAWQSISNNGLIGDLANSFLFSASENQIEFQDNVLAMHYGVQRPSMYARESQFVVSENRILVGTRPTKMKTLFNDNPWKYSEYIPGTFWFTEMIRVINGASFKTLN